MPRLGRVLIGLVRGPSSAITSKRYPPRGGKSRDGRGPESLVDLGQRRELLPLDVGQESPAAGRNMGHLVIESELLDGLGCFATADHGDRLAPGHRLGD